ncbi:sensor histidine kinase [Methanofollis formosanus]|nr:ATP-binding protein [Methanofollis formosanus]
MDDPDLAAVLASLPMPVGVVDREGRVISANARFLSVPEETFSSPDFSAFLASAAEEGSASLSLCIGPDLCEVRGTVVPGSGGRRVTITLLPDTSAEHQAGKRLATVNAIIRATADPDTLAGVLTEVARLTVGLLDFDAGAVYLTDRSGGPARLQAYHGLYHLYFPETLGSDEWEAHWQTVFCEGRASYTEAYLGVPHEEGELGVYSVAAVPVLGPSGAVIGALAAASSSPHRFTPEEQETLEAIGREIGGFVHRAALTEDLAAAREEAEFYLDLMTHDINNANMVSLGSLDLLMEGLTGEERALAGQCLSGIRESCEIIKDVRVIRACRKEEPALRPVSLDRVVGAEAARLQGPEVSYEGNGMLVFADELLGRVFGNLFGNSVKFGGEKVCITVSAKEEGDRAVITVADNGPGIPDPAKPRVFERLYRSGSQKQGRGMGLYLAEVLVRRYGGEIRVGDRVPGRPGEGAAFSFTVRLADSGGRGGTVPS